MVIKIVKKSAPAPTVQVTVQAAPKKKIIINKRAQTDIENVVEGTVRATKSPEAAPPAKKLDQSDYKHLPVASSPEELEKNRATMRAPDPTVCEFCDHLYSFPCHGKSSSCMNVKFKKGEKL